VKDGRSSSVYGVECVDDDGGATEINGARKSVAQSSIMFAKCFTAAEIPGKTKPGEISYSTELFDYF
jgi:hypothetical protein